MSISAGLGGAAILLEDGSCYMWGRFGRLNCNIPRQLTRERGLLGNVESNFVQVCVGDEFIVVATDRGEVLVMG